MRHILPLFLIGGLLMAGCTTPEQPEGANNPAAVETPQAPTQRSAADRSVGDSLLAVMGSVQGKVVADLFAGDGYYTWTLLDAGARVLAIDHDPAKIAALEARKKAENIGDDRLLIRLGQPGTTGLSPNEVDMALITREYSQLGDRKAWFAQMMADVREPHTFFLVNYVPQQSPTGPPLSQRMDFNTVADEVMEFGYGDVGILYKKIPYRYILFGAVVPPDDGEGE